jgi:signal transduction histidine kinase
MKSGSLRLRLLLAAAVSIALALGLAGFGLTILFQRYVERRVAQELSDHLLQLAAGIQVASDSKITVAHELADPRFNQPFSGLYWQVDANGTDIARSRSLWDEKLDMPSPPKGFEDVHLHRITGPGGASLFAEERYAVVTVDGKEQPLVITVGLDEEEIEEAVTAFSRDLMLSLAVLGVALIAAAWLQVSIGLRPLELLRTSLERVRSGAAARLEGTFPSEVQPLAAEVNGLLAARDDELLRARQRAGDLAHGLKTPLTVLSAISRDVASAGLIAQARDVEAQTEHMRRHIERELARARLASGHASALTPVRMTLERLIEAIKRAPRGEDLVWMVNVPAGTQAAIERGDLTELLGNLLDNARKWARTRVEICLQDDALVIGDDGPGVPRGKTAHVLERGTRLDEATQGSGLGLAIVRDIAETYGLSVSLARSPLGGLEVTIPLTRARHQAA